MSTVVTVQNPFVAMLFDIRFKPGTERRVKDIYRAQHITNSWHVKAEEGDTEAKERLEQLSGLLRERIEKLNSLTGEVNDLYEQNKDDLPIVKKEKFHEFMCELRFDNPHNRALMMMLEALDLTSTRMNILFWNKKYQPKSAYFELQKEVANPLRSVLQWIYKQASTH